MISGFGYLLANIGSWPKQPKQWSTQACNCIGPQQGSPLCPCQMRGVTIKNGRYVKEVDYGPAPKKEQAR